MGPIRKKTQKIRLSKFDRVNWRNEEKQMERIVMVGKRKKGWSKIRWSDKAAVDLRGREWSLGDVLNLIEWRRRLRGGNADHV